MVILHHIQVIPYPLFVPLFFSPLPSFSLFLLLTFFLPPSLPPLLSHSFPSFPPLFHTVEFFGPILIRENYNIRVNGDKSQIKKNNKWLSVQSHSCSKFCLWAHRVSGEGTCMQPSEEHSVKSYSKRMIAGLMGYPGSFTFFSSFFHLFAIYPSFMSSEKDALGDIKKMRKLLLLNSCDVKIQFRQR